MNFIFGKKNVNAFNESEFLCSVGQDVWEERRGEIQSKSTVQSLTYFQQKKLTSCEYKKNIKPVIFF